MEVVGGLVVVNFSRTAFPRFESGSFCVNVRQANTFTIKLAGKELYISASNGRDIALSDIEQDKWELLPDSGNVIRHANTGKFLGISSTFLDSQVRLTVQVGCLTN